MKLFGPLALFLAASSGAAVATPPGCGLDKVRTLGELQALLSVRAVDAVRLAATPAAAADRRLERLVSPAAPFSSGGGDVGLPMGTGVGGLRALARDMQAVSFRYYGWDGIPTPVGNACTMQKVEVEFIDATGRNAFPVTFTFEAGRIVAAEGWRRSLEVGRLDRGGGGY